MKIAVLAVALVTQQPQDTVTLNPVVVTGTRVPVRADRLSSAITVLRGSDLVAEGIRTVADALQLATGAFVLGAGSCGGSAAVFMQGTERHYGQVVLDGRPRALS